MASSYHARRERHAPNPSGPTPTEPSAPSTSHASSSHRSGLSLEARWAGRLNRHPVEELNRLTVSPLVRRKRAHGQRNTHEPLYITLKRFKSSPAEAHPGISASNMEATTSTSSSTSGSQLTLRSASSAGLTASVATTLAKTGGWNRNLAIAVSNGSAANEDHEPVRSDPSRPMTVRGRHFRERLRNAVLDEDKDALRRRVRELESEKLVLSDKASQRKTKILQYKAAKVEQANKFFRVTTENARLKAEIKEVQRDKQAADQSHLREIKEVRHRLEVMKKRAEKAELERAKAESQLSQTTGGESFLQDILSNFKEMLETNLQCAICSEVLILSTTVSCGHTFCEDCIASWKEKTVRRWPTCPICRTVIDFQASNLVLDDYIDKVVETFFPEETRKIRADMLQDRRVKKTNRDKASKLREGRLRHFFLSQFGDSDNESSRGDGFAIQEVDLPGTASLTTTSSSQSETSLTSVASDGSFSPASTSSVVRSSTSGSRSSSRSRSRTPESRSSPVRGRSISPVVNQFSSDHEFTEDEFPDEDYIPPNEEDEDFQDPRQHVPDDELEGDSDDFEEPQYSYQDDSPDEEDQEAGEPADEDDFSDTGYPAFVESVSFDYGESDIDDIGL